MSARRLPAQAPARLPTPPRAPAPPARDFRPVPKIPFETPFLALETLMRTLVLSPWMSPETVVSWQRAICLLLLGKVEVVEEWDVPIASPSLTLLAPSVVRAVRPRRRRRGVAFSRLGVFARDGFCCRYCGGAFPVKELTLDHVVPRSRGGLTVWENIVTACHPCNARKGDKTLAEVGYRLDEKPSRPRSISLETIAGRKDVPAAWRRYG